MIFPFLSPKQETALERGRKAYLNAVSIKCNPFKRGPDCTIKSNSDYADWNTGWMQMYHRHLEVA